MNDSTIGIARIKKPHRHFSVGDLVVGDLCDGQADNLVVWGWSSKHRKIVGGKHGYRLRYCKWKSLSRRFRRAAENAKFDNPGAYSIYVPTGNGHLRIIKWVKGKSIDDMLPPQPRNEAWLRRLLIELSCGNIPLSREEATPSKRIF